MSGPCVGHVCGQFDPAPDGVADYTRQLARHLRSIGLDPLICTAHVWCSPAGWRATPSAAARRWRCAASSGGCVLLETPNPANLVMAACDFYNAPTHRSPLPSALMECLVSTQGFGDVVIRALPPKPSPFPRYSGEGVSPQVHELLTHLLWGPRDYAVLGYKLPDQAG